MGVARGCLVGSGSLARRVVVVVLGRVPPVPKQDVTARRKTAGAFRRATPRYGLGNTSSVPLWWTLSGWIWQ